MKSQEPTRMWDPRAYIDTDFGLVDDERFEPEEEDDILRTSLVPHVNTVLGPIEPDELGIAFVAEHLLFALDPAGGQEPLDSVPKAIDELTSFATTGARTIVDIATSATGRDVLGLVDIARRVPAHIITSTGGDAASIEREANDGIGRRRVRPGLAVIDPALSEWRESANAAQACGLPRLFLSSPPNDAALDGDLDAVIDDGRTDSDAPFRVISLSGDPTRLAFCIRRVSELVDAGMAHRLMLAMGWDQRSRWHAWDGQPGLAFGMERMPLALMDSGVSAVDIRRMLVDVPARWLTVQPNNSRSPRLFIETT